MNGQTYPKGAVSRWNLDPKHVVPPLTVKFWLNDISFDVGSILRWLERTDGSDVCRGAGTGTDDEAVPFSWAEGHCLIEGKSRALPHLINAQVYLKGGELAW
jgi:hypothetical protein